MTLLEELHIRSLKVDLSKKVNHFGTNPSLFLIKSNEHMYFFRYEVCPWLRYSLIPCQALKR